MAQQGWSIGLAVLTARRAQGMEQTELATRLAEVTGRSAWTQSKLSRIETGKTKNVSAADLMDLHRVQGMPYAWYLDGPADLVDAVIPGELNPKLADLIAAGQGVLALAS